MYLNVIFQSLGMALIVASFQTGLIIGPAIGGKYINIVKYKYIYIYICVCVCVCVFVYVAVDTCISH